MSDDGHTTTPVEATPDSWYDDTPITDAQYAEVWDSAMAVQERPSYSRHIVRKLLAAHDDLREQLAAANERAETAEAERDRFCGAFTTAVQRAAAAESARDEHKHTRDQALGQCSAYLRESLAAHDELRQLRARLDGLGELDPAGMEYRANGPFMHDVSEEHVRGYFTPDGWAEGYWPEQRQLYAGPWHRVTDAAAGGHSTTESPGNDAAEHRDASQSTEPPQTPRGADT